ncbi:MAG: hypothetical protein WB679_00265 [Terracidiphilus sp.]
MVLTVFNDQSARCEKNASCGGQLPDAQGDSMRASFPIAGHRAFPLIVVGSSSKLELRPMFQRHLLHETVVLST